MSTEARCIHKYTNKNENIKSRNKQTCKTEEYVEWCLQGTKFRLYFSCQQNNCGDYKEYGQQMKKGKEKQKHDICRPLSTKTRLNIFINFNPYFVGQ